ncbi:MAG: prepilin peptidase [Phycisphaerales bacterium]|nr:MAG: prepilin peptidase [Phycisphaerales bacterium]
MSYEWIMLLWAAVQVLWIGALGACVGSLTNVLVYRLPRGLSVVTPPSRCPSCSTRLTWRENVPILGWLLLGGKCRFCKAKISAEYPIVEGVAALLFVLFYAIWYMTPNHGTSPIGVEWQAFKPEWAMNGIQITWPTLVVVLTLFSCLLATTLIDARTYTIPLELTWIPVGVALVAHPVHALWVSAASRTGELPITADGWVWSIATPGPMGWWWVGASIGGVLGVVIANVLLRAGLLKPSFADYDEWEAGERAKVASEAQAADAEAASGSVIPPSEGVLAPDAGEAVEEGDDAFASGVSHDPEMWIQYPHARREVLKELLFLAPALGLGMVGGWLATRLAGPGGADILTGRVVYDATVPLWLDALSGVLMGYLVGAGVVWGVRIFGSLAFGKEAMGLGDVHLLAAIGACLGWVDAVLAFFAACFAGAFWGLAGRVFSGVFAKALPFGPYLAAGALAVVLFKHPIELGLTRLLRVPGGIDLP